MSRSAALPLLGALMVALAVVAAAPLVGSTRLPAAEVWGAVLHPSAADPVTARIVALRLVRVALGFVVGGCLAVAGGAFQTLLGNPLATPYTLGVASAGAFGAFLGLAVPAMSGLGALGSAPVQALLWCALDLAVLTALARRAHWGPTALVLGGVTMSFLFAAGTMLLRLLSDPFRLQAMDRWLMGGLEVVGWEVPAALAAQAAPGLLVLLLAAPALDQLAFGDQAAHGRGVPVARVRLLVLAAGVWVTAAAVARVGPIAFVGLLVPHGVRLLLGPGHRRVLPASLLLGGAFLVACDAAARAIPLLGRGAELPVGVLTALVGGPLFLGLLARNGKRAA